MKVFGFFFKYMFIYLFFILIVCFMWLELIIMCLSFLKELGSSHADGGKVHHQSVVKLFESQWSTLQMVVLREILLSSVRAGDPLAAWSAAARLLRSYYPLITPAGQSGLASALANSAERLPSGTRCADPALPFVRLFIFIFFLFL